MPAKQGIPKLSQMWRNKYGYQIKIFECQLKFHKHFQKLAYLPNQEYL